MLTVLPGVRGRFADALVVACVATAGCGYQMLGDRATAAREAGGFCVESDEAPTSYADVVAEVRRGAVEALAAHHLAGCGQGAFVLALGAPSTRVEPTAIVLAAGDREDDRAVAGEQRPVARAMRVTVTATARVKCAREREHVGEVRVQTTQQQHMGYAAVADEHLHREQAAVVEASRRAGAALVEQVVYGALPDCRGEGR